MTRLIALAVLLLPAVAQASEPGACQELSTAELAFVEARDHVDHLVEVAFGDNFDRKIASAHFDERDALVAQREAARTQLRDARKDKRDARKELREARGDVDEAGIVCVPADADETAA